MDYKNIIKKLLSPIIYIPRAISDLFAGDDDVKMMPLPQILTPLESAAVPFKIYDGHGNVMGECRSFEISSRWNNNNPNAYISTMPVSLPATISTTPTTATAAMGVTTNVGSGFIANWWMCESLRFVGAGVDGVDGVDGVMNRYIHEIHDPRLNISIQTEARMERWRRR